MDASSSILQSTTTSTARSTQSSSTRNSNMAIGSGSRSQPHPQPPVVAGPFIQIKLRTNIQSAPPNYNQQHSIHNKINQVRLSTGTKIQKLLEKYQSLHPITKYSTVKFVFDGLVQSNEQIMQVNLMDKMSSTSSGLGGSMAAISAESTVVSINTFIIVFNITLSVMYSRFVRLEKSRKNKKYEAI